MNFIQTIFSEAPPPGDSSMGCFRLSKGTGVEVKSLKILIEREKETRKADTQSTKDSGFSFFDRRLSGKKEEERKEEKEGKEEERKSPKP